MLEKSNLTALVGRRLSGKSTLLMKMLLSDEFNLKEQYDRVIFICPNFFLSDLYKLVQLPKNQIKTEYSNVFLNSLIEHQKRSNKEEILLILDDCVSEKDFKSQDANHPLNKLATIGRHLHISCILVSQKFSLLSTTIRANLDYVFVFSTHNRNEREAIFNEIGIGSFREFNKVLDHVFTDPHKFLYYNARTQKYHNGFREMQIRLT